MRAIENMTASELKEGDRILYRTPKGQKTAVVKSVEIIGETVNFTFKDGRSGAAELDRRVGSVLRPTRGKGAQLMKHYFKVKESDGTYTIRITSGGNSETLIDGVRGCNAARAIDKLYRETIWITTAADAKRKEKEPSS